MASARKLGTKIFDFKAHNGHVTSLDLGETGRVLVTGGHDCTVNLWAIGQDECFMSLTGHGRAIDCVRFAYNDNFVYSTDDTGSIRRWDLNAQQTICSTLHGHMKSVRTLDFNPSGEYIVSGSNDTTVRLWDVRNHNKSIKVYRGHMAHVNSAKFSPDGLWIASGGTEGSVIIWDIRKSRQIMEFIEPKAAAITCIQFHPSEFLLAVGRLDGSVSIYDLEMRKRISRIAENNYFFGHPIRCITFSENGECLFVGTAIGMSVVGWEPDRVFDNIQSTWSSLGDMKVFNGKLLFGSYEQEIVSIYALSTSRIMPFYNPSNSPAFRHNSTTRKSFTRGNQKLRLSIGASKPSRVVEENEDSKSPSLDGHSSPNLSLELVDDLTHDIFTTSTAVLPSSTTSMQYPLNDYAHTNGNMHISSTYDAAPYTSVGNVPQRKTAASPPYNYTPLASSTGYSSLGGSSLLSCMPMDGPSSLKMPGERDTYLYDRMLNSYMDEMEYNLNNSNPPIITNYDHNEMVEDFPVNQNLQPNGPPPSINGGAPTSASTTATSTYQQQSKMTKHKSTSNIQKRSSQQMSLANVRANSTAYQQRSKLSQVSSVSSTDLHKLDDNMLLKKSASSHLVNKSRRNVVDAQQAANLNKENARNKNITVQIITKPPTRSRTSLDLRSPPNASNAVHRQSHIPISYRPDPSLLTQTNAHPKSLSNRNGNDSFDDSNEIQMLSTSHETVFQELSNRHATLQLIRNSTRAHDVVGALKHAIKINGRTVFVDLLGAILEKTSTWSLDLCLLLLPEIYELLQSQHKFHYTRACDTLRVILSQFLPIIQENLDPWAACGLGVDVTREERQRKCIDCQHWLLQIRNLPESTHFGTTLAQLQNMIVNI